MRGDAKSIIWACCFLWPSTHTAYASFSELGHALKEKGLQLVLFGVEGDYSQYTGFRFFPVSTCLAEQGERLSMQPCNYDPIDVDALHEMVCIDQAFNSQLSFVEAGPLVERSLSFWERAFDILQPTAILTWGTSIPFARLLYRLGQRRHVLTYVMERGLLENTVSISLSGQVALSSINTSPSLVRPPALDETNQAEWDKIESYCRAIGSMQDHAVHRSPNSEEESFLLTDPKPRVLFLGNYDLGSGSALTDPVFSERVSTWVCTSAEAGRKVAEAMGRVCPEAALWSKPHPSSHPTNFYVLQSDAAPNVVRNFPKVNVHRLIQAADVVVTMTSTTQVLALIYDRPFVTLGNGFFMGRDIGYEVGSEDQLIPMLAAALARDGWAERLARGRALMMAMVKHDLFRFSDDAPTRLNVVDLACMLGRLATATPDDHSVVDRLLVFQGFCLQTGGCFYQEINVSHVERLDAVQAVN